MASLAHSVRLHARLRPDALALIEGDRRISYRELDALAAGCAARLSVLGIGVGDRVAIVVPNSVAFVVAYQGIMQAGAIPVPLNPKLAKAEIRTILRDCEPAVLFAPGGAELLTAPEQGKPRCHLFDLDGEGLAAVSTPAPSAPIPMCAPTDTGLILYSSGSTGQPKGVELSHYNLLWNAQAFAVDLLRLTPDDRGYGVLPFTHVFGHTCLYLTFLYVGASIVLAPRFDPVETLETIARERVTVFMGVPSMYWTLTKAEVADDLDLSRWRACVSGGQALPEQVHHDFEDRFSVPISEGYGMTEASPSVCGARLFGAPRKFGSAGQPYWGVSLRIIDDEGREVPNGERGEILVSTPGLAKGYFRRPEMTAEAFRDGWLHTGDIGYVDDDGFLFVVDRKKEIIISGGYNVYPREIEEVAHRMTGVLEVAAIGEPDDRLGERIVAYVVPEDGVVIDAEQLLAEWGACLARYKVPREVRVVTALPRNATGKIDRIGVRAMAATSGKSS